MLIESQYEAQRTVVVDGVPQAEDGEDTPKQRSPAGILAVDIARLEAAHRGLRCRALGQLGVELDERGKRGALAAGLQRKLLGHQ